MPKEKPGPKKEKGNLFHQKGEGKKIFVEGVLGYDLSYCMLEICATEASSFILLSATLAE